MTDYIATPKLRWTLKKQSQGFYSSPVRIGALWEGGDFYVLEQWWAPNPYKDPDHADGRGEWRDVGLET